MSLFCFLPNLDVSCFLSYCLATVEPFKNKIVDHTSADQGKVHISWGCRYYFCELLYFYFLYYHDQLVQALCYKFGDQFSENLSLKLEFIRKPICGHNEHPIPSFC